VRCLKFWPALVVSASTVKGREYTTSYEPILSRIHSNLRGILEKELSDGKKFRLYRVNAPEVKEPYFEEAKAFTENLV